LIHTTMRHRIIGTLPPLLGHVTGGTHRGESDVMDAKGTCWWGRKARGGVFAEGKEGSVEKVSESMALMYINIIDTLEIDAAMHHVSLESYRHRRYALSHILSIFLLMRRHLLLFPCISHKIMIRYVRIMISLIVIQLLRCK